MTPFVPIPTGARCPKCDGDLFHYSPRSNNIFGCVYGCGTVWQIIDGQLLPTLEAEREIWEQETLDNGREVKECLK